MSNTRKRKTVDISKKLEELKPIDYPTTQASNLEHYQVSELVENKNLYVFNEFPKKHMIQITIEGTDEIAVFNFDKNTTALKNFASYLLSISKK